MSSGVDQVQTSNILGASVGASDDDVIITGEAWPEEENKRRLQIKADLIKDYKLHLRDKIKLQISTQIRVLLRLRKAIRKLTRLSK